MAIKVTAIFDGTVFRPVTPLDLEPNMEYQMMVEAPGQAVGSDGNGPSHSRAAAEELSEAELANLPHPSDAAILALSCNFGISDLVEQLDHYLYGTPKR